MTDFKTFILNLCQGRPSYLHPAQYRRMVDEAIQAFAEKLEAPLYIRSSHHTKSRNFGIKTGIPYSIIQDPIPRLLPQGACVVMLEPIVQSEVQAFYFQQFHQFLATRPDIDLWIFKIW